MQLPGILIEFSISGQKKQTLLFADWDHWDRYEDSLPSEKMVVIHQWQRIEGENHAHSH